MNKKHTRASISELIQKRWESDTPDQVLEALKPLNGKLVTTRILDKLPGGKSVWRLRRAYGMTHLQNEAYDRSQGNDPDGVCLLLAHTESSFPLDVVHVEERNPAYFSARKHRNVRRMEARNDAAALDRMASVMNRIERARAELDAATKDFDALAEFDSIFDPDKYELERACGLRNEKGRK